MNLNCPSCQKMLQVPDQYAGQMMKCPLCGGTFPVPGLAGGGAAPPAPATAPSAPMMDDAHSSPYGNEPVGGYQHVYTFYFSPKLVGWIAPLSLLLVFILLLTPWLRAANALPGDSTTNTGWQTIIGEYNSTLGLLYGLVFIPTLLLSFAATIAGLMPSGSLPPGLLQLLPFRSFIVLVASLVTFVFLAMQLAGGFGMQNLPHMKNELILTTFWLRLTVFAHVMAIIASAMDFWLAMRGSSKPIPKLELTW